MQHLTLAGQLDSADYRKCDEAGRYLAEQRGGTYTFKTLRMMPADYAKWRKNAADVVRNVEGDCVVTTEDNSQCWNAAEFVAMVKKTCGFKLFDLPDDDPNSYASLAKESYKSFLRSTGDSFTWVDVAVDDGEPRRIVFQLYSKKCPKTVENFRHLCMGDLPSRKDAKGNQVKLHYKGTTLFRVVGDGWIQGGDISSPGTMKAGHGGVSIFGDTFPDESYDVPHTEEGVLGMANTGPHTNGSQFYITLARNSWMDRRYVAFGRVVDGLEHVRHIHTIPTKANQAPTKPITIVDCGLLSVD